MENRNIQSVGSSNQSNRVQSMEQKKYKATSADGVEHTPNSDRATLSVEAQVLAKSLSALNSIDDVRQEKVTAIKEKIDSGTYEVKYQNIASRIEQLLQQISD
ncbi:MAG: flagellar biosynthesis anti-sigma factor FlgM [Anaerolineaceae bacterium]|nr:flagellar biosynthesis anti-sigma factor FlgM [Anaerolineaceae bacterium]